MDRIDNEVREFLWFLTIEAQFDKNYEKRVSRSVLWWIAYSVGFCPTSGGSLKVDGVASLPGGLAEGVPTPSVGQIYRISSAVRSGHTRGKTKADGALAGASRGSGPKPLRRRPKSSAEDVELRRIAESRPESHEDMFHALDGRVNVSRAKPFANAGGWMNGFKRDKPAARAWLSRAWTRLPATARLSGVSAQAAHPGR